MIKIIPLFIIIIIYNMFNVCVAETVIKNNAEHKEKIVYPIIDYHADRNGFVYKKREKNYKIEAKVRYYRENIDNEKDMYNFFMEVRYNNKIKKLKYLGTRAVIDIDIINAQSTVEFCNKEYIVLTIREYYYPIVMNNYLEMFLDFNKKNKDYFVFQYDDFSYETNGPLPLSYINRRIKHICLEDSIEFIDEEKK